jgi:hypothetical protein
MADDSIVHIAENSPDAVAYKLLERITFANGASAMREPIRGPIFAILALVLWATATASVAQSTGQETLSADPRTRCAQLIAFWQRHGGSKSEGGGGGDIARKNAEVDCGAGRYESGIRAMEELLRRNGYTVPPS